jgi:plasmid stabilization system protein ParE
MAEFEVVWITRAKIDFDENILFLLENWSEREARKFIRKAMSTIRIIENNPRAFQESDYHQVRKAPILKQISLYYRINQNTIELLRFWGNRMNPEEIQASI